MRKEYEYNDHRRYVANCFNILKELDLIDTQASFSELYLDKHKSYYSSVLARNDIDFSLHSLSRLVGRLNETRSNLVRDFEDKEKLRLAYQYGMSYLTERVKHINLPEHEVILMERK